MSRTDSYGGAQAKRSPSECSEHEMTVEDFKKVLGPRTSQHFEKMVDADGDGIVSVDEVANLFKTLEKDEKKIKVLRWELVAAVIMLAISIAANAATSWYAAEKHQTTSTILVETPGDQPNPHMLTDIDGIVLRTDRTKDEVALSSQLPDAAFDELEKLRIEGPTGKVNFKVTGFARYTEKASRCGSVVVIYTGAGNVQFDGVAMTFDETVAGSFSRAGFKVSTRRRQRRDATGQPGGYTLTGITNVIGMFNFVSKLDTSSLKCGDDIPSVTNNPFVGATDVLLTEDMMYACGEKDDHFECPSGGEVVNILGANYFKRVRTTHAKFVDGKWFTAAHTVITEAPKGSNTVVEVSNGVNTQYYTKTDSGCHYARSVSNTENVGFSTDSLDVMTAEDYTMRFVGYDVINGVYVRHYKIRDNTFESGLLAAAAKTSPEANVTWVDSGRQSHEISMFEHYDENRLYGLFVAAPSHLDTYESIVVDPSAAQLKAAGMQGWSFPVSSSGAAAEAWSNSSLACDNYEQSVHGGKMDLALYQSADPWTQEHADQTLAEAAEKLKEEAEAAEADAQYSAAVLEWAKNEPRPTAEEEAEVRAAQDTIPQLMAKKTEEADVYEANGDFDVSLAGGGERGRRMGPGAGFRMPGISVSPQGKVTFTPPPPPPVPPPPYTVYKKISYPLPRVVTLTSAVKVLGPLTLTMSTCLEDGQFPCMMFDARARTCLPGLCGNPKLELYAGASAFLSAKIPSSTISIDAGIIFSVNILGLTIRFEIFFGASVDAGGTMKMWAGFKLSVGVAKIEPKLTAEWTPPMPFPRAPNGIEVACKVCAFWVCGTISFPLSKKPMG